MVVHTKKSSYVVKIHCEVNSTRFFYYANFIAHLHFTMITFMYKRKWKGTFECTKSTKAHCGECEGERRKKNLFLVGTFLLSASSLWLSNGAIYVCVLFGYYGELKPYQNLCYAYMLKISTLFSLKQRKTKLFY